MTDLVATGLFAALMCAAVGVGEGLRWVGWSAEETRRFVHVAGGLAGAAAPLWMSGPEGMVALSVAFVLGNAVALGRGWFPSMHGVERRSWGTVLFPLAFLVGTALAWSPLADRVWALQAAFAVLALSDPAASLVGMRWARHRYRVGAGTKSVEGSVACAVLAFLASGAILLAIGPDRGLGWVVEAALSAAALATIAEALGLRGWDNVWIVVAVILSLTVSDMEPEAGRLALAVGLGAAFIALTVRAGVLDVSGALAGSLLAWGLVAVGGWGWAVPALAFFVGSSALSRVGRSRKRGAEALAVKGSRRDAGQVLANGGVAMAALAATAFVGAPVLFVVFAGALAAAAADTWATEIGTWVGGVTRRLGVGPSVPPGTSGGMSVGGTVGMLAGAASVAVPAGWVAGLGGAWMGAVVAAGVGGALLDTVLGATLQARYRAPDGRPTERTHADGAALPLVAGRRWLGNDAVNAACTLGGAVLAGLLVG